MKRRHVNKTRLRVPCESGAFKNTTFILHTDCVPDDVKAKDPEFWAHMPIQRAYVVRHNFGEGRRMFFLFYIYIYILRL